MTAPTAATMTAMAHQGSRAGSSPFLMPGTVRRAHGTCQPHNRNGEPDASHDVTGGDGVTITLADIYAAQQEMTVKLAEIGGALALQSQQDRNDKATLTDHESRLRKVEAKVYALPSAATIISLAALAWALYGK